MSRAPDPELVVRDADGREVWCRHSGAEAGGDITIGLDWPSLPPDGCGEDRIVLSPASARHIAQGLLKLADEAIAAQTTDTSPAKEETR